MFTSPRGALAVTLAVLYASSAPGAKAQTGTPTDDSPSNQQGSGVVTVTANAALLTDYRFRGVSLSGGDPAVQGGLDIAHANGFYAGAWGSSIDGGASYGEVEFDIYAGWTGQISDAVSLDVGIMYYSYPSEDLGLDTDYWEPYASAGFTLGPAEAKVGVAYAFDQDALANEDNLYLYSDLSTGIPGTPVTITGHVGFTDGVQAPPYLAGTPDDTGWDWSLAANVRHGIVDLGLAYVGVEGPSIDGYTDDAVVASLSASF